ncbi:MAG: DUF2183 domain-containing protein, partial [Flavobacterium sp.]|nr:DUF2183 domain-containing protein [Flavobacterium sp.]
MKKRLLKLFGRYAVTNLLIVPYRSYGTNFHLYVKGRLLDNEPLRIADNNFFKTIANTMRQFDTYEVPGVEVTLHIAGMNLTTVTDRKGYFLFDDILPADIGMLTDPEGWVLFKLSAVTATGQSSEFQGRLLIPEQEADFGVISDIDDTILHTGVTSFLKWKLVRNSLFVNAYRRLPLQGAADLYQKLHRGVANKEKNPVFYISNSPWNLYEYLKLFLDHNNFPKGPILLRSFSSLFQRAVESEKPHKQKEIINILKTYPELNFILIGDSGEHDASIYTEIAAQFPHRILCIYLRSVKHKRRMEYVRSIVDSFTTVPVLLVETS